MLDGLSQNGRTTEAARPSSVDAPKGARILAVEDDAAFARSLVALLVHAGHEVKHCVTGLAGLAALSEESFDLLLVDLSLPDISGHELIERAALAGSQVPVIVVSGETQIDAAISALRRGAADYVRKPLEPDILKHSIAKVLRQHMLERRHAEFQRRMEESERLHRFLVDSSPDLIFTLDRQGNIVFVNDRLEALLGFDRGAAIGRHFSALAYETDRDRARYAFNAAKLAEKTLHNLDLRLTSGTHPRGMRHFEVLLSAVQASSGEPGADPDASPEVGRYYGVARDVTERREAEERAAFHANHDALTGLPSHTLFRDRLSLALTQARRNREGLAVAFLNLNRFKPLNDLLGQDKGDELLRRVPERIHRCLRGGDTLARFSGDEFLLLITQVASRGEVLAVIERIESELRQPIRLDGKDVSVSLSAGVALYPDNGISPEALIRNANIALYHGKLDGIHVPTFFHDDMASTAAYKLQIEDELRHAGERDEFDLYYQPQVDIQGRRIMGVEALIRWNHPKRGQLCPGDFLPVAEEAGLMGGISEWVLDKACRDLAVWEGQGIAPSRVGVNISPKFLERDDFVERFLAAIRRHRVDPARIEMEITENLFIKDPPATVGKLRALSDHGIKVAIDDFGTQYSSLSYLQRLPVHTLKIDKSFVSAIDFVNRQNAIIRAIISIAQSLDLNLIAEGVETEDQARFLAEQGCREIQGFLVSRPVSFQAMEPWLSAPARAHA